MKPARRGRHAPAWQIEKLRCQDNHFNDDFDVCCSRFGNGLKWFVGGPTCLETSFEASPTCLGCFGMILRTFIFRDSRTSVSPFFDLLKRACARARCIAGRWGVAHLVRHALKYFWWEIQPKTTVKFSRSDHFHDQKMTFVENPPQKVRCLRPDQLARHRSRITL